MISTVIVTLGLVLMSMALFLFLGGPRRFEAALQGRREDPYHAAWIMSVAMIINLGTGLLLLAAILAA